MHAGAAQAASEIGGVEIIWKGPHREDDRDQQISIVQDFITSRVNGLVLAPLDSQALVPPVKDAQQEGIPTVIFDSGLDDASVTVSYVATDNYVGGAIAGREMGKRLKGEGDVILLRYNLGSESTEQRERGFLETLQKEFPKINILSENQYSGTTPETSLKVSEQLLQQFGDKVDGAFAVCEPNATGMLGALEGAGLAGKVVFIGFDPSPRMVDALRDGKMQGIVLQDPVQMGYQAVKTLVDHLEGRPVQARISTGEYIATRENMDDPKIKKLLSPAQFGEK